MHKNKKDVPGDAASPDKDSFGISAPAITLPKGGGAVRGIGEKFAANPVTGTGSMSVPITTSPGRSGFGPQLSLSYDSGAGNSPFGLGWNLSLPSITRKTDKGLPRYQDADESDVFILSGAEDLVPVLKLDAAGNVPPDPSGRPQFVEDTHNGYRIRRYRPRIEGMFARIEKWSALDGSHAFWRSISKDNITTWYGKTEESRIADPTDSARIFSWLICESYDDKGNAIRYQYKAENADGVDLAAANERNRSRTAQHYLKRIKYGNKTPRQLNENIVLRTDWMFEVVFDYGEHYAEDTQGQPTVIDIKDTQRPWSIRQDPFSSYRSGFEVRTYRLCQRVLMFHHFPGDLEIEDYLVRATHFTISPDPATSFITGVTQSGYQWQAATATYLKKSLPPVEFEYSKANIDETVRDVDADSLENLPYGLDGANYQWVDLDGEGLSGILTEQGGAWFYKRNLGAVPISAPHEVPRYAARFAPVERLPTMPSSANLKGGQQLLDLAGDGQLDVVEFDGPAPGFFERTLDQGWETFVSFTSLPNVAWKDPNLKFVDLTGDGHADILITENEVFTWYASLAEEGFGPAEKVHQPFDEEAGPRLVFADGTQSIYLSDLSGDGLTDLVRIRNGEVCYWPNLGYGRFGKKVTMDNAPWFDAPDQFDQKRIRLADIDGSGTVDIIYLGRDSIYLFFNNAGNSWGPVRKLNTFPRVDNLSSVMATDLLGNGTACLVWSSPLPGDARRPMRYIDLMGGQKPHLLTKTINNLGAETKVDYTPSTKFYLADKLAGRPWITKLPFPVYCVARVSVVDHWRNTEFASTYSYHHGYFDGVEREFRGFGRVEQVDVESYGKFQQGNVASPYITDDHDLYQPPVKTITWFHTGAASDRPRILTQFQKEYFPNSLAALPGYSAHLSGFNEKPLPEPDLETQDLNADEWREALRACKGMMLRQEIYELDVDQVDVGKQIPVRIFSTASHNCHVRRLQPKGRNQYAVFLVTESEALSYHYELDLREITFPPDPENIEPLEPDPRVAHTLNLSFDDYGNIQQSVAVGYKRAKLFVDPELSDPVALIHQVQGEQHLAYSETHYTNDAIEPLAGASFIQQYRLRVPCEVQTYELTAISPLPGKFYFDLADLRHYVLSTRYPALLPTTPVASKLYHEQPQAGVASRRLVEHARTLFFIDDPTDTVNFLKKPFRLGKLGPLGLPYEQYKLALTDALLNAVFTTAKLNDTAPNGITVLATLRAPLISGYISGTHFFSPPGPVAPPEAANEYWLCSGIAGFATDAATHFYLPEEYTDPFGNKTTLSYGNYDLFIQSSTDALGNRTGIYVDLDPNIGTRFDYRVLAPIEMEDINGNRTEAWFDVLGRVIATAIKGKGTEADSLSGYTIALANPNLATILTLFDLPPSTPEQARARFSPILGNATTRFVYHFGEKIENGTTVWASRPAGACAIVREQHVASLPGNSLSPLQLAFECSDGMGTVLMKRSQAEPETTGAQENNLRWIVSGKTVLNNKGKPVKQYEPYFSTRAICSREGDPQEEVGVTSLIYYDAVGRVMRTEMPDGTLSRVEFSPWQVKSFDANDTIHEPNNVWYAQHSAASASDEDKRAAKFTLPHQDTPALTILDSLGREVIAIAYNRVEDANGLRVIDGKNYRDERYLTFTKLDAEGKPLWVRDARGNLVMQYIAPAKANNEPSNTLPTSAVPCYDIAGNLLFQHSMDAGDRWMLMDAAGKPMLAWDTNQTLDVVPTSSENRIYLTEYDGLHRPTKQWLTINTDLPKMVERFEYVDTAGNPNIAAHKAANLIGQLVKHYNPSGLVETLRLDFSGNVLEVQRRLNNQPRESLIDWSTTNTDSLLETETFIQITEYDALKRMTKLYNWHRDITFAPDGTQQATPGKTNRVAVYLPEYNQRSALVSEQLHVRASKATDPNGRVSFTADAQRSQQAIQEIHYNAKGQKELLKLGNGTTTRYDYDEKTFRLRQLRTTRPAYDPPFPQLRSTLSNAQVLQQLLYTYDPVSNITEIEEQAYKPIYFANGIAEPKSQYEYDALYRLIFATGRETAQGGDAAKDGRDAVVANGFPITDQTLRRYTQSYEYDSVGNFVTMRHAVPTDSASSWTRAYTCAIDSNRLLSTQQGSNTTNYGYDTHGNMLNLANVPDEYRMQWDHRDMIRSINLGGGGTAYYQYDASKQRTRKRIENQNGLGGYWERIYLGGYELYRRYNAANPAVLVEEIESLHLLEGEQRVLLVDDVITASGAVKPRSDGLTVKAQTLFRYQYSNHLGSACLELDHQADVISYEEYHPYGTSAYRAMKSGTEAPPMRYRYTGMERDEESGLEYHGARHYSPWLARWTSCDPKGSIDGPNRYRFVQGNPLRYVDPTGTEKESPAKGHATERWSESELHMILNSSEREVRDFRDTEYIPTDPIAKVSEYDVLDREHNVKVLATINWALSTAIKTHTQSDGTLNTTRSKIISEALAKLVNLREENDENSESVIYRDADHYLVGRAQEWKKYLPEFVAASENGRVWTGPLAIYYYDFGKALQFIKQSLGGGNSFKSSKMEPAAVGGKYWALLGLGHYLKFDQAGRETKEAPNLTLQIPQDVLARQPFVPKPSPLEQFIQGSGFRLPIMPNPITVPRMP